MTEQVEQRICIKFCMKLEHYSTETIWMIQKATAMGNWWLAALSRQHAHSCRVFWWNIKSSSWLSPLIAQIWHPVTSVFSKTKITFEKEEISEHRWDSGKCDGAADGDWEKCVRSQGAYFEGDWDIIVLCTMFLVPCIFFNKCLYFSCYMAGYFLDRLYICLCICPKYWAPFWKFKVCLNI